MKDRIKGLRSIPLEKIRGFRHGNPKTHTEKDRQLLESSFEEHGYVLPIAVREDGDGYELIDGHHRLEVLGARGAGKVKVIVLDVETVEEGRRMILSLKHTAGWDMSALEDYVKNMITDEVATTEDVMRMTGLSASDLDVLASAGADFLDRIGGTHAADGQDTQDGEAKSASRAGQLTEHVTFSTPLARDQNEVVHRALKLCKTLRQAEDKKLTTGDALAVICQLYLEDKEKQA